MDSIVNVKDVKVGFHPDGFRIDKTAAPMNRYTKWDITSGQDWRNPVAVCFDCLPVTGWVVVNKFDWDTIVIKTEADFI